MQVNIQPLLFKEVNEQHEYNCLVIVYPFYSNFSMPINTVCKENYFLFVFTMTITNVTYHIIVLQLESTTVYLNRGIIIKQFI